MTIDEILDEVEQSDREATPGPWFAQMDGMTIRTTDLDASVRGPRIADTSRSEGLPTYQVVANALLIESYRSHAPALAAEVRRLRAQFDEGMSELARLRDLLTPRTYKAGDPVPNDVLWLAPLKGRYIHPGDRWLPIPPPSSELSEGGK